ncbi:aldo/keto reductase [Dehalococcoidia bacterium]|nr:aldo/keto reductase [Dehalococcoidia bacterium]
MTELPRRMLGNTGLEISVLGFGSLELRGIVAGVGRSIDETRAETILNQVLDSGINYIDTSVDYGDSEKRIGKFISARRSEFILATKCGCPPDISKFPPEERTRYGVPLPGLHDYSRKNIVDTLDQSLSRLNTDYIDVLQLHFSPSVELLKHECAIETLTHLKQEGKIRFIGCSSILPNIMDHINMGVFDVLQIPYSKLDPAHEGAIHLAAEAGIGTVIRGGVAKGLPNQQHSSADAWELWDQANLEEFLNDMTRIEFLLRLTISNPDVHTAIIGTSNPEHLEANIAAAAAGPLSTEVYAEISGRLLNISESP